MDAVVVLCMCGDGKCTISSPGEAPPLPPTSPITRAAGALPVERSKEEEFTLWTNEDWAGFDSVQSQSRETSLDVSQCRRARLDIT